MRVLRWVLLTAAPALIAGVIAWQITGFGLGHWLQIHLGIANEPGPYYGFFSGSGSDLGEVALIGAVGTLIAGLWHKFNCHNAGCMRIGLHQLAGGTYVVCRKHHAVVTGHPHRKLTTEFLAAAHQEHLIRTTACPPGTPVPPPARPEPVVFDRLPPPPPVYPWYQRVIMLAWHYLTWPWQARQLKRAGFRRTGWMTWEAGPPDG